MGERQLVRRLGRPRLYPHLRDPRHLPLASEIKEFRQSVGLSQFRLAQLMQIDEWTVYWWERGHTPSRALWSVFVRVRRNYQQKLRRQGKELDGGPLMEEK